MAWLLLPLFVAAVGCTAAVDETVASSPRVEATALSRPSALTAEDGDSPSRFADALASDGASVVFGAWGSDARRGGAYWLGQEATAGAMPEPLPLNDLNVGDRGGHAVAVAGDTLAVSAIRASTEHGRTGRVHVFARSGANWEPRAVLRPSEIEAGAEFGGALALRGEDVLFVGAPGATAGRVFVYQRDADGWSEADVLVPPRAMEDLRFGAALAAGPRHLLVGAWPRVPGQRGAAALFTLEGDRWRHRVTVRADAFDTRFGVAVTVDGDHFAVGEPFADEQPVRVWRSADGGWREETVDGWDGPAGLAGHAVLARRERLYVGDPGFDGDRRNQGRAVAFRVADGAWRPCGSVVADRPVEDGAFGGSLAVWGPLLVVGAARSAGGEPGSGAAYLAEDPCS